ncbi:VOC family protein [Rhizobium sp. BK251]|uniref:VOC family protein n=1 Tax=Rhizobium sp. BK251 TaxID=2512125 RepID=UPI0010498740|nr:VOC family protein [Rhizobium sp. BK251]TCL75581.1 phospholipase/carboxylesterase [Rhizobium sp. BK251]
MVAGIHHVTLITRKVQANVDFYAGFLGLRLVKRTAGFEDATQLHLFYGDAAASPGSLITFLVWEDGAPGRAGFGQIGEISLAIDPASTGYWLTRALSFGLRPEGPLDEFGEPTLRLKDPDGVIVKLVGVAGLAPGAAVAGGEVAAEHSIRRIRGVTFLTETPDLTQAFLEKHFGYHFLSRTASITRLESSAGDIVDVRNAQGFWTSAPGTGTVDHIAFRARDDEELEAVHRSLRSLNSSATNAHDRKYFRSLYVREPGGILIELATDAPGMTVDEPEAALGERLFIPDEASGRAEELKVVLPQFSMPGEERVVYRDLPFVHRFFTPPDPDGSVVVLLHGSGGNETTMMPLLHAALPRATLLGVRGRATEEGHPRWYRRITPISFDQDDIKSEADAFAAFIEGARKAYGLDPKKMIYAGYSNGANLLNSLALLHPHLVRRAILLRSMPVLNRPPSADLSDLDVLVVSGDQDMYGRFAKPLAKLLKANGARVDFNMLPVGHEVGDPDVPLIRRWVAGESGEIIQAASSAQK